LGLLRLTMESITIKVDEDMAREIDKAMKPLYSTKTEFIREAIRKKVEEVKLRQAMQEIAHLRGASKKKTTDEEYERIREKAFKELSKEFK